MNLKRLILSILFLLFITDYCFSQQNKSVEPQPKHFSEHNDMPSSLFMALTKLDSAITSFFAHPKARRLSRELNYFKIDLQKYLRIRYSIMTLLEQHNYDYNYFVDNSKGDFMLTGDLHSNVHALQKQLKVLMDESAKLAAYVDDYPDLPQDLSEQFYITGQEQATSYLYEVDQLLAHKTVDHQKLRKEGRVIYDQLEKCVDLVTEMQKKLEKI